MRKQTGLMKFFKSNSVLCVGCLAAVIIIAAVFFVSEVSEAKVRGQCTNCHTMHNSQDGTDMVRTFGDESNFFPTALCGGCHLKPRENLLTESCIACHAKSLAPGPALPVIDGVHPIPQVVYDPSESLAAGNFYSTFGTDLNGHNVHGFGSSIGAILLDTNQGDPMAPPGYDAAMDYGSPNFDSGVAPGQVMCAGAYGCHGNRGVISQSRAIAGSHHANDSMLKFGTINISAQGATSGTSYRFLSGVQGGEHATWESNATPSNHNEYIGEGVGGRTTTTQSPGDINTMSEFCAGCHGNFHMFSAVADQGIVPGATRQSPWIRHPSDVLLPGEAPYNAYTSYKLSAPIARKTTIDNSYPKEAVTIATGTGAAVTGADGDAVVFCLSCHRAHASEEADSLRFSYIDMITGDGATSGEGCFACHSDK